VDWSGVTRSFVEWKENDTFALSWWCNVNP